MADPADAVRSIGYRTDLMLLALQGSTIEDVGDAWTIRSPHNPAFHWGNFLLVKQEGLVAGDDVARWLGRFTPAFPGAAHRCLGVDDPVGALPPGVEPAVAAAGLEVERHTVMVGRAGEVGGVGADHPEVECRPLSTDAEWQASAELDLAEHTDQPAEEFAEFVTAKVRAFRRLQDGGHGAWFGAFIGDRLAGQLGLFTDGSGLARFQDVLTSSRFRRRGLARALVAHACRTAVDDWDVRRLVMVADPGYHAITLYRSLGFADAEAQLAISRPVD